MGGGGGGVSSAILPPCPPPHPSPRYLSLSTRSSASVSVQRLGSTQDRQTGHPKHSLLCMFLASWHGKVVAYTFCFSIFILVCNSYCPKLSAFSPPEGRKRKQNRTCWMSEQGLYVQLKSHLFLHWFKINSSQCLKRTMKLKRAVKKTKRRRLVRRALD